MVRREMYVGVMPPSILQIACLKSHPHVINCVMEEPIMVQKTSTKKVNRDSGTGQFVTDGYAKTHPKTTETERVRVPVSPKPKKR